MDAKTIQAHNTLAAKEQRIAHICSLFGMTEHAADARRRQARMVDPLHAMALVENELRDLRR